MLLPGTRTNIAAVVKADAMIFVMERIVLDLGIDVIFRSQQDTCTLTCRQGNSRENSCKDNW